MSSAIIDGMQAEIASQGLKVEEMVEGVEAEAKATKKRAPRKAKAETKEEASAE